MLWNKIINFEDALDVNFIPSPFFGSFLNFGFVGTWEKKKFIY